MASEDVFRIDKGLTSDPAWVIRLAIDGGWVVVFRSQSKSECETALAPILEREQELRKDRDRLDRLLLSPGIQIYSDELGEHWATTREQVDAAMGEAKGE